MSLESNLIEMEQTRENYWRRHETTTSPIKLRWRAIAVRHCLHVLPGETFLELGAGSGLWTEHLSHSMRGECPITAAVFNPYLARQAEARCLPNVTVKLVADLAADLRELGFDYIVGTGILCHRDYEFNLGVLYKLLKPGGQMLFF
jgi:ubiquinone/menaquinone biosynthesis C-methylase UbiE